MNWKGRRGPFPKSISAIDLTATQVHWPFCGIKCWTMLDSVCVVVVIIKANDLESLMLGELFKVLESRWS